jgi:hypothetical protein
MAASDVMCSLGKASMIGRHAVGYSLAANLALGRHKPQFLRGRSQDRCDGRNELCTGAGEGCVPPVPPLSIWDDTAGPAHSAAAQQVCI